MTGEVLALIERLERKPAVLVSGFGHRLVWAARDQPLTKRAQPAHPASATISARPGRTRPTARHASAAVVLLRIGLVLGTEGGLLSRGAHAVRIRPGRTGRRRTAMDVLDRARRSDPPDRPCHRQRRSRRARQRDGADHRLPTPKFAEELGRRAASAGDDAASGDRCCGPGGDFAEELLLGGQRVLPAKALASGFSFRHGDLASALGYILGEPTMDKSGRRLSAGAASRHRAGPAPAGR